MSEVVRRRESAALAGHLKDVATIVRFLDDPDASVRATALAALQRANALTSAHVLRGLADESPTVRRRACELAISFEDIDLVACLTDEPFVVEQAAWALGERAEHAGSVAVQALAAVTTTHEDALCREAAVAALGAIGDEEGLAAILQATRDKPAIRRRAVLALAPFEGPEVDAALVRAAEDRDWQVRQAAEDLTS